MTTSAAKMIDKRNWQGQQQVIPAPHLLHLWALFLSLHLLSLYLPSSCKKLM
jgi:hypothetical protein